MSECSREDNDSMCITYTIITIVIFKFLNKGLDSGDRV